MEDSLKLLNNVATCFQENSYHSQVLRHCSEDGNECFLRRNVLPLWIIQGALNGCQMELFHERRNFYSTLGIPSLERKYDSGILNSRFTSAFCTPSRQSNAFLKSHANS